MFSQGKEESNSVSAALPDSVCGTLPSGKEDNVELKTRSPTFTTR